MNDTYVSLDLEMTGVHPESQEVVEIAAVKFRGDRILGTWSRLVKPSVPLPYNVQVLTGIRPEDLARAPTLSEVADQLTAFLGKLPLVAHTVSADVGCLQRQGIELSNPQIDTFELASVLLPQMSSYSLAALAEHFGIPFPTQHRAAADALVTKQLFLELVRLARELDLSVLQEINRLVAPFDWPLKKVFREAEAVRARTATFGASIRQQLAAKAADDDLPLEVLLLSSPAEEPLQPSAERQALDVPALAGLLGPDGLLAQRFPGYEHRPTQVRMLEAVAEAFDRGQRLVAEAGAGTGRSLAYLLPAIAFAVANGEPVVVATSSPGLRERIYQRDLPSLRELLPWPFRAALVKSRSSYLCLRRWTALRHRQDLSLAEALTLAKILVWLPTTQTGDVAELNLTDAERAIWRRISADEGCTPDLCQHARRGACFLDRACRAAASAHVVVTSHAVLLSDLAAERRLLPDYRFLVVDEAHRLEDEATEHLGREIRLGDLLAHLEDVAGSRGLIADLPAHLQGGDVRPVERQAANAAGHALAGAVGAARAATVELATALASFLREASSDSRGNERRVRLTKGLRARPSWQKVQSAWEALAERLGETQEDLRRLEACLRGLAGRRIRDHEALMGRLFALRGFEERLQAEVAAAVANPDARQVYWVSLDASGDVELHAAPIHVGESLASDLFGPREAVVLTSNALSVGGSCAYVRGRLGLDDAADLAVDSPFDYARSALLYLPTDGPEPEQPTYQEHLQRALLDLCSATQGRTLVLFTSHSQLRQTWKGIHKRLADKGILVLGQGVDGSSRRNLVQTFKTNPKTVLLATGSFWEHLDVSGDALSVLVIARLPFAPPGDPVVAARSEGLRDPLGEYSLPQTILRFKQGFGRLIRSRQDRGLAVVFDRRIQTKSYGEAILASLPPCTVRSGPTRDLPAEAVRWLGAR